MAVELATAYISLIPSARGIEKNIATELAPVTGIASKQGEVAGAALGGSFVSKFAGKTGNLLQGIDRQIGSFGGPFTGNLTTIGTSLRAVELGERGATSGASEFQRVATGAYVGIGLAAAGFGAISIKSALGAEQAHAQLDQAIQHTKGSYDEYGHAIDGAVSKLAAFGFDQEEVESALAKLTRATKDPAKALDLIGLAADVARARNLDLGTATQILVNIEAGRVRGLAQLGISTKDSTGHTIDAATAVARITALYSGAAAANAKTYAGELQAVGAQAHNLEENIGGALLPVVANLGKEFVSGVHGLEDINTATHGWLGTLGLAAFAAGAVVVAVTKIGSGISKLTDLLNVNKAATEGLAATQTVAAGGDVAVVAGGVASVGAPAAGAVTEAELTIARAHLADTTIAVTEAQAQFDAALLAGAGAEEADLTSAVGLTEADRALAAAKQELAAATAEVTALTETETTANTGLGLSLATVSGALAGAAAGFVLGKAAGDEINKILIGTKPNVDRLTASLIDLEKHGTGGLDFKGLASTLNAQISTSGNPLELPVKFGQSLVDAVTGGDAHKAKADIGAINDALKSVLSTQGVEAASVAYTKFTQGLIAQGASATTLSNDFEPFLAKLDLARTLEDKTAGSTNDLSSSFTDLAGSFAKTTARLGIADQLDAAKTAVDDLEQIKLDAAGQGQKSIAAARAEEQAQQSLSDAYRSQATAAAGLTDAKEKLAQFDGPTDTRIRVLEQQNIEGRVVTTPEEARQKEIDLLQFSENNANTRASLQNQVVAAENGVTSATEQVAKAQQSVSDASAARRKVQTDAAAAIAGAERKAQEAILGAGKAISDANVAGQLGAGNTQLDIYVGLLDELSNRLAPNSDLTKRLNTFLQGVQLSLIGKKLLEGSQPPAGPQGPASSSSASLRPAPVVTVPDQTLKPGQSFTGPPVVIQQHNEFHGSATPTTTELDTLNKKQAIRLTARGVRGRH